jgi:DNA-binding NarL/FixJ family response regulator
VSTTPVRVLLVDDSARWRQSARRLLKDHAELQIVAEVADGLEAVQKANELHPDLILLDIGLPQLNGIEAAKQIQRVVPSAQIIFVTINSDADFARAALSNGAQGYVVKTYAARELWSAIETVLQGKQYVSTRLSLPFKVTPN